MALLSPEYLEQNKALHADRTGYGAGSYRWSQLVSDLRDEIGATTVLDFGCGKGTLGYALGKPDWLTEYDPAIPGKDEEPTKQVDLVVCTDVIEHIEPAHLDEVLETLRRLAKKALFLVINTRPSTKTLNDGRNAHLLVKTPAEWRAILEEKFNVLSWGTNEREIVVVLKRLHTIDDIKVTSAVSDTIRFENAQRNSAIVKRRLYLQERHEKRVVVACYGPSLKQTWPGIAIEQRNGALVVSVSGAHDFLIERGIIPDVHVDVDPRIHKADFTSKPHPKIAYWMASCCHPKTIDQLAGYDLTLWHVFNSDEDARILEEIDRDGFLVSGGGSVGCRVVSLLYTQGYRDFSIYGMDCSFEDGTGEQHAGPHSGKVQKGLRAKCGGRWYPTSGTLVAIARGFMEVVDALDKVSKMHNEPTPYEGDCIRVELHGDGLLLAMANARSKDVRLDVERPQDFTKEAAEAA